MRLRFSKKTAITMSLLTTMMVSTTIANAEEYKYFPMAAGAYAPSVAAELGGFTTQLNSYDQAFMNMDMYMLNSKAKRKALKKSNKSSAISGAINSAIDGGNIWAQSYSTFESVPFKHGPKVSNVTYGQFFGAESNIIELDNGWDGVIGLYAGYNGSHQAYDGMKIYQNGGTLGIVGMAYKDNFFVGSTINVGANGGEFKQDAESLDFGMIMSGIAAKTGYNWELANGKFIIQPNYKMSYSFVNLFDKKDDFHISPMHVINMEPGVKLIGNFESGWQPYTGLSMVWNFMDNSQTFSDDRTDCSSKIHMKPYIKYGFGVRKIFGERFTGFFQTYFTNIGRNGVGLNLGLSVALGEKSTKTANNYDFSLPEKEQSNINIKNVK